MASSTASRSADRVPVPGPRSGGRGQVVKPGRLPVSEFLLDRPGAASPFGDDQTFPLPVSALVYRHPDPPSR